MMIIELPVAPNSPPPEIERWIRSLEAMRRDPEAEPRDLWLIEDYLARARAWLDGARARESAA